MTHINLSTFLNWSLWLQRFTEVLKKLLRAGKIGEFVSVHVNPKHVGKRDIVYFEFINLWISFSQLLYSITVSSIF